MAVTTYNSTGLFSRSAGKETGIMVKVLITRGTVINGVGAVSPGEEHEVDARDAKALFVADKAVPAPEKPKAPTVRKPAPTTRKKKKAEK